MCTYRYIHTYYGTSVSFLQHSEAAIELPRLKLTLLPKGGRLEVKDSGGWFVTWLAFSMGKFRDVLYYIQNMYKYIDTIYV